MGSCFEKVDPRALETDSRSGSPNKTFESTAMLDNTLIFLAAKSTLGSMMTFFLLFAGTGVYLIVKALDGFKESTQEFPDQGPRSSHLQDMIGWREAGSQHRQSNDLLSRLPERSARILVMIAGAGMIVLGCLFPIKHFF